MMRVHAVVALLVGLLTQEASGACPAVDDPCMTAENHGQCQALVDHGCTNLIWMESCPLQFACGAYDRPKNLRTSPPKPKPQPVPGTCGRR